MVPAFISEFAGLSRQPWPKRALMIGLAVVLSLGGVVGLNLSALLFPSFHGLAATPLWIGWFQICMCLLVGMAGGYFLFAAWGLLRKGNDLAVRHIAASLLLLAIGIGLTTFTPDPHPDPEEVPSRLAGYLALFSPVLLYLVYLAIWKGLARVLRTSDTAPSEIQQDFAGRAGQ